MIIAAAAAVAAPSRLSAMSSVVPLSKYISSGNVIHSAEDIESAFTRIAAQASGCLIDGHYHFSGTIHITNEINLVGISPDQSALLHDGIGTAIDITSPCSLSNMTIGGGRTTLNRVGSQPFSLVDIHGKGKSAADGRTRLSGISVKNVTIRNTNCSIALSLANLESAHVDGLTLNSCWGNGLVVFGAKNCILNNINAEDIGNINSSGVRQGSGLAIFCERDENKSPGPWYVRGMEEDTDGVFVGSVKCFSCSDTAIYIHGYPTGPFTRNIDIASAEVKYAGKDGLKIRYFVSDVRVGSACISNVALRGVSIEDSNNIVFNSLTISDCGVDIAPRVGLKKLSSGNITVAQSIASMPTGLLVLRSRSVTVKDAAIKAIRADPILHKYGFGINVSNSSNVNISALVTGAENSELTATDVADSDIRIRYDKSSFLNPSTKHTRLDNSDKSGNNRFSITAI